MSTSSQSSTTASGSYSALDKLGHGLYVNPKWPLEPIEAQGWELQKIEKEELDPPHMYLKSFEWKEFKRDEETIKYKHPLQVDIVHHYITYTWKKGDFVCNHVESFNPVAVLDERLVAH